MHEVKKFQVIIISAALFCLIVAIWFRLNQNHYGKAGEEGFFTKLFSQYREGSASTSTDGFKMPRKSPKEQAEEFRKLLIEYGIATLTSTSTPTLLQTTSTEENMQDATTSPE